MDPLNTNRRMNPRVDVNGVVVFEDEHGQGIIRLPFQNISMGGMYISDEIPMKVGGHAFLSFVLPGQNDRCRLVGEVVRTRGGMGVRFVDLPDDVRSALTAFLSTFA